MSEASENTILALETSGRRGGVAVLRGEKLLANGEIPADARTAATLTPLIAEQLEQAHLTLQQINLTAVPSGPGSFTGLRVGVTTAKTLAYVLGCDVLGLNTLEVIAQQVPAEVDAVWAVLDAQRQQLFAARFERDPCGRMRPVESTAIIDNADWLARLRGGESVTGPGLRRLQDRLGSDVHVVDSQFWEPRAETVARLAKRHYDAGRRDDFWKLVPQYFRQSAAEEKLAK